MQTADQINLPQTGQVTSTFPPTVNITAKPAKEPAKGWHSGTLKGTRASVLKAISESSLTDAQKAVLVEEVGLIPEPHELIRVDFHRHNHLSGGNGAYTVTEL